MKSSAMDTIRKAAPFYAATGPAETDPAKQVNDILRLRTPSFSEVIRTREPNS